MLIVCTDMDKFSLDKVTLSTILDTRRVKDDLNYPVKYRITYLRKQYYYPSGIDLTEDQWKALEHTRKKEMIENRELITSGFDKIKTHIKDMVRGEGFTLQRLSERLSQGTQNSIISEFERKIKLLNEAGRVTTASSYNSAIRNIQKFTSKDLKFSEVTVDWLKKYEAYLLEEERTLTTIRIYLI